MVTIDFILVDVLSDRFETFLPIFLSNLDILTDNFLVVLFLIKELLEFKSISQNDKQESGEGAAGIQVSKPK